MTVEKQRVIRELQYFPVDKIFLQMQKQFGKAKGLSGFANTTLLSTLPRSCCFATGGISVEI